MSETLERRSRRVTELAMTPRTALVLGLIMAMMMAVCFDQAEAVSKSKILTVGAWNVQTFGPSKFTTGKVIRRIAATVARFDVTLVQEVRDASGKAAEDLLNLMDKRYWGLKISKRLGAGIHKEQYAYYYRKDKVEPVDEYQSGVRSIARPPFCVKWKFKKTGYQFFTVPLHSTPNSDGVTTVRELTKLSEVYTTAASRLKTSDALILGDFNMSNCGNYVPNYKLDDIPMWRDQDKFTWIFDGTWDTTVRGSQREEICNYDRIVAAGGMRTRIIPGSAIVLDFRRVNWLWRHTMKTALKISDHLPVGIAINCSKRCRGKGFWGTIGSWIGLGSAIVVTGGTFAMQRRGVLPGPLHPAARGLAAKGNHADKLKDTKHADAEAEELGAALKSALSAASDDPGGNNSEATALVTAT